MVGIKSKSILAPYHLLANIIILVAKIIFSSKNSTLSTTELISKKCPIISPLSLYNFSLSSSGSYFLQKILKNFFFWKTSILS